MSEHESPIGEALHVVGHGGHEGYGVEGDSGWLFQCAEKGDARRFAALWNACAAIPTASMEEAGADFARMALDNGVAALVANNRANDLQRVIAERDALAAHIRRIANAFYEFKAEGDETLGMVLAELIDAADARAALRSPEAADPEEAQRYRIQIDREYYTVRTAILLGREVRILGGIPADRDLWLRCPGAPDQRIALGGRVELTNGTRLYSAPALINNSAPQEAASGDTAQRRPISGQPIAARRQRGDEDPEARTTGVRRTARR